MTALAATQKSNVKTALMAGAIAIGMVGMGFAAVPLYRIFCQVTGFGGTTMRVSEAQAATVQAVSKTVVVRFDANQRGLPWEFKPERPTDTVSIGARDMSVFIAKNLSDQPVTGTATFNVTPAQAGKYFNKIQCFCFTEQTLKAGEQIRMPVLYYVDPKIMTDPDTKDIEEITLSYTFYPVDQPGQGS
ncbi:cytochrome c oxidase assembly protein [Sphingorhabdus pulchriflava]|uniref:Cytochrome c oxidase assembly protein CtaG n=1 Tax=Sphingorhabdus pulchriflava TaxID=2292257 RepID=A0A371B1Z3_9SPHN|nr:cytochrome c oxidase assembly protein [Sphingorhabdus pulchriflava]RDV01570.1 cytochrome c oxidase assembly protein [Sphingorhabdus pulchriflava]